jgi:hypothetical protein
MQLSLREQMLEDAAHAFERVAAALPLPREGEADLRLHPVVVQVHADVADEHSFRRVLQRVLEPARSARIAVASSDTSRCASPSCSGADHD